MHQLYRLDVTMLARIVSEIAHSRTGIDIHPGAESGKGFFIDHGTGVVIGETAVIDRRARLYQAVTLGAKRFEADENGALVKGRARHPIIEGEVVIYAGARQRFFHWRQCLADAWRGDGNQCHPGQGAQRNLRQRRRHIGLAPLSWVESRRVQSWTSAMRPFKMAIGSGGQPRIWRSTGITFETAPTQA